MPKNRMMVPHPQNIWAVLPLKEQALSKSRLSGFLSGTERARLSHAMARDVLSSLAGVSELSGILVVSNDRCAQDLARQFGAALLADEPAVSSVAKNGLSRAVETAAQFLVRARADAMLVLPGDIPLVTSEDISSALATHLPTPAASLAPAFNEGGTNCLIVSPPDLIPFSFGVNSFRVHTASARSAGADVQTITCEGIALDIDRPVDIHRLLGLPSLEDKAPATARVLKEMSLKDRPDDFAVRGRNNLRGVKS